MTKFNDARLYLPQSTEIDDYLQDNINKGIPNGLMCTRMDEHVPHFRKAECETLISGNEITHGSDNNSYIILGRDRPGNLATGCGGMGLPAAGMIDLVVGRAALESAALVSENKMPLTEDDKVNPNFITDAARIYITQKCFTGIDEYFGFASGETYSSKFKSAIGIKADHTRLIGRESVRIYAGPAQNVKGFKNNAYETNSSGGALEKPKIELIAGKEDRLEPAVLGNKLKEYLEDLEEEIQDIQDAIKVICENLISINSTFTVITQGASPFSTNLKDNINSVFDTVIKTLNSKLRLVDALDDMEVISGSGSILSKSVYIS